MPYGCPGRWCQPCVSSFFLNSANGKPKQEFRKEEGGGSFLNSLPASLTRAAMRVSQDLLYVNSFHFTSGNKWCNWAWNTTSSSELSLISCCKEYLYKHAFQYSYFEGANYFLLKHWLINPVCKCTHLEKETTQSVNDGRLTLLALWVPNWCVNGNKGVFYFNYIHLYTELIKKLHL